MPLLSSCIIFLRAYPPPPTNYLEIVYRLVLGHYFNHPVTNLKLPATLRRLAFTGIFDQSLDGVSCPPRLESVELGQAFSGDVAGVK